VSSDPLSSRLELEWMPSGEHSFKPTRASGLVEEDNWARAVEAGDRFLRRLLAA
jgi:predicted alpha/beta-hydrolase family hydrolase